MSQNTDWRREAACIGVDPRAFFAEGRYAVEQSRSARGICATCPVQARCAEFAIQVGERYGVWGGMTQRELRQRRQRPRRKPRQPKAAAKRREPAKCGTRGGYQKHLREKTKICAPCRQANTDTDNRLRRTGTTRELAS
jgi:hypothetical protein